MNEWRYDGVITSPRLGTAELRSATFNEQTRTLRSSSTSGLFSGEIERAVAAGTESAHGATDPAQLSQGDAVSSVAEEEPTGVEQLLASLASRNVAISLTANPFNPTGGFHARAEPETQAAETTYTLDGAATTAPGINPEGWGVPMATRGLSFLPFKPVYLTGNSPLGGPYASGYVSPETAQNLVDYMATLGFSGAEVSESLPYGLPGQTSPGELLLTFPDGQQFGAIHLLQKVAEYGPGYVARMLSPNA
jgi:hypothetical protein